MNGVPLGEVEPLCAQCGAQLLVDRAGDEPHPQDRVLCPVHGLIGTREEVFAHVIEQSRDKIGQHVADLLRDALGKSGFDLE